MLSLGDLMSLLIRNGEIVTDGKRLRADVLVEGETIARVAPGIVAPEGTEGIDAAGEGGVPGFIDPHVHIYLPFMGTFAKDTHETASIAALTGGTTCFVEMICPAHSDKPLEAF